MNRLCPVQGTYFNLILFLSWITHSVFVFRRELNRKNLYFHGKWLDFMRAVCPKSTKMEISANEKNIQYKLDFRKFRYIYVEHVKNVEYVYSAWESLLSKQEISNKYKDEMKQSIDTYYAIVNSKESTLRMKEKRDFPSFCPPSSPDLTAILLSYCHSLLQFIFSCHS